MKTTQLFTMVLFATATLTLHSCKKCAECHYDLNGNEVEIGEYCKDELKKVESEGYSVNGTMMEVHCHGH